MALMLGADVQTGRAMCMPGGCTLCVCVCVVRFFSEWVGIRYYILYVIYQIKVSMAFYSHVWT